MNQNILAANKAASARDASSDFASAQRAGLPRGLPGDADHRSRTYVHRSLEQAEQRGGETAVLRQIEQRVVSEFIMRCQRNGINVRDLSREDLSAGVSSTLRGMVDPSKTQMATQSFDGFREMYRFSCNDLLLTGKRISEQHVQGIVDAMLVTMQSNLSSTEREAMEARIVRETLVAASAYRVAGINPIRVIDLVRANTDVGHLPIVEVMRQSVHDEFQSVLNRRKEAAKMPKLPKPHPQGMGAYE